MARVNRTLKVAGGEAATPVRVTLLELVAAVGEVTDDEEEVAATVLHMLRSGRAKLCGSFASEPIEHLAL
jgi:hypothetical protein